MLFEITKSGRYFTVSNPQTGFWGFNEGDGDRPYDVVAFVSSEVGADIAPGYGRMLSE